MKLNRLETHDRYQEFTKKQFSIGECCQNIIDQRPFGSHPFYIFAHARTDDDGVTKRLIWQPRLTKPRAQTNSMLFKGFPGSDNLQVFWIIPDEVLWKQFNTGNVTESKIVQESIHKYLHFREQLEAKEPDDLDDGQIDAIYRQISLGKKYIMV
jgi:hypothetical protein